MNFKTLCRTFLGILATVGVVGLAGPSCATLKKKLGMRVDLVGKKVAGVTLDSVPKVPMCPGSKTSVIVKVAVAEGGPPLVTVGGGDGKLLWESIALEADGAAAVKDEGDHKMLWLTENAKDIQRRPPFLNVTSPQNADVKIEKWPVPVRYDCAYVGDYAGNEGKPGREGREGYNASSKYEDGGNGGIGGDGEYGSHGDDVTGNVTLVTPEGADHPSLQVCTTGKREKNERCWLVDTKGGSLLIDARGGEGGKGGKGGSSGSGGEKGHSGNAGGGGRGGDGGRGGRVTMTFDPASDPFRKLVKIKVRGGKGGKAGSMGGMSIGFGGPDLGGRAGEDGPEPEILSQPVAALW